MPPVVADALAKLYPNETGQTGGIFALTVKDVMKDFGAL